MSANETAIIADSMVPGWNVEWSKVFDNEFAGTSVSVVILAATRK